MSTHISGELLAALHTLLDEALERAPQQRAAWLAELRLVQPVHAAELERLLAEEAELDRGGFLSGPWPGVPPMAVPGLAGQRLSAWTLERPLGQGGMGTVWLARRSDGRFEGTAAVKLLNLALLDPVGAERFRREGTVLARLNHPHIARLLDAGVTDGGQPYLVLEHVEGERIDRYADRHRLPPDARLRLVLDVMAAVAHAHASLIVHRDLKPSNILVAADGTVKLLDFGIAKLLEDEAGAEASTLTDRGGRALTPEYAAPEQVTGAAVTTATDVYALGVLLYTLLTGRHPTGEGRSTAEYLKHVIETEPPRLSTGVTNADGRAMPPEKLRRLYEGDLDNIVAKALKKRPEERYATVGAFADDVRRHLNHEPVTARPDSWQYRAGKFVRRHRVPVAAVMLAVTALAAGLTGTITQAARAEREARSAADERDFALRELARAEAYNELNDFLLLEAAPSGQPFTVGTLLALAESLVERDRGLGADRAALLVDLGVQYARLEEPVKARRMLERGYALSREMPDPAVRARAACSLGAALAASGEVERADTLVREALHELPEARRHGLDRVNCLLMASEVASTRGDMAGAVSQAEEAARLHAQLRFAGPSQGHYVQSALALFYQRAGRYADAVRAFERTHQQLVELGRERTRSAGTLYNNWALMLGIAGQPVAAESLFRRAVDIERGDSSALSVSPVLLGNFARTLYELDRTAAAARYADHAHAKARRAGDEYTASVLLRIRAAIHTRRGELEPAGRMLAELGSRLSEYPANHPAWMHLLAVRAQYLLARGELDAAMAAADSAVGFARVLPGASQFLAPMLLRRAEVALAMQRFGDAESDAGAARKAAGQLLGGAPSAHVGNAELLRAHALHSRGNEAEARRAFQAAAAQLHPTLGPDHPKTREAARLAGD